MILEFKRKKNNNAIANMERNIEMLQKKIKKKWKDKDLKIQNQHKICLQEWDQSFNLRIAIQYIKGKIF